MVLRANIKRFEKLYYEDSTPQDMNQNESIKLNQHRYEDELSVRTCLNEFILMYRQEKSKFEDISKLLRESASKIQQLYPENEREKNLNRVIETQEVEISRNKRLLKKSKKRSA